RHVPTTPFGQVIVEEKRRLTRRWRTFERLSADTDDHATPFESLQNVADRERTLNRIELVSAFNQTRGGREIVVSTERDHEDVGVERTAIRHDTFRSGIDRANGGLHESHTGFDDVSVRMTNRCGRLMSEHHVELREAKDK